MAESGRVLNPVLIEEAIREAADLVYDGVDEVTRRLEAYREAEASYDLAYAMAFMAHKGPQTEKRYAAEISAHEKRVARDVAEVAYKHAERRMKSAESRLSAYQTLSKSITAAYGAAGRGEY